jgi:ubiquinol-cytochrome c reductase iron-sulfur subunit
MTNSCVSCAAAEPMDAKRRQLLIATSIAGAVAGAGIAIPLLSSMAPSERARAAGAPVEVDIAKLAPGAIMTVEWRGKPVWFVHRTTQMLAALKAAEPHLVDPQSTRQQQPAYATNEHRSIKPEIMVVIGICTHLGCSPTDKFKAGSEQGMAADWPGGFFCPCHGSQFDLAGRVFKNMPAPTNLEVPPHKYLAETRVVVGEDQSVG